MHATDSSTAWVESHDSRHTALNPVPQEMPELLDFCDVRFLAYCGTRNDYRAGLKCYEATDRRHAPLLTWFHVPYISHCQETLSSISTIVQKLGHLLHYPYQPITLPIGSGFYNAMLATPIVKEFAKLLIRYRRIVGPSVITSISIYNSWTLDSELQIGQSAPGLLVHAARPDQQLVAIRRVNRDYEIRNAPDGRYDWPWKLRPGLFQGREAEAIPFWLPEPPPNQVSVEQASTEPVREGTKPLVSLVLLTDAEVRSSPFLAAGLGRFNAMLGKANTIPTQIISPTISSAMNSGWRVKSMVEPNVEPLRFLDGYVGIEGYQSSDRRSSRFKSPSVSIAALDQWADSEDFYQNVSISDVAVSSSP